MQRTKTILAATLASALLAGVAQAQHAPPHDKAASDRTVNIQGPQGQFANEQVMLSFYQVLLEYHKQGDKADLDAMEAKIKSMIPAAFNGGKPVSKAMEDHVLGVAHQALAMGVSNPKMFESYKDFTAAMMGPQ